jgi:hypothetical protein
MGWEKMTDWKNMEGSERGLFKVVPEGKEDEKLQSA